LRQAGERHDEDPGLMDWNALGSSSWWNAVGALGQWAGAVATFSAVVVALKQAHDMTTVRVRVSVTMGFAALGSQISDPMVIVSATNQGHRPVRLTATGMLMPDGRQLVFLEDVRDALPKTLQEAETTQYHVPVGVIARKLREEGFTGEVMVRFYFSDTQDLRHWGKWRISIGGAAEPSAPDQAR
jgi:hypothetical protein